MVLYRVLRLLHKGCRAKAPSIEPHLSLVLHASSHAPRDAGFDMNICLSYMSLAWVVGLLPLVAPTCHTPKFSLIFLKTFHTPMLKDFSRVDQTNSLLDSQPRLGFGISQIKMDFQHLQWSSYLLICFKDSPCQVSSLISQVSSDNCSDG